MPGKKMASIKNERQYERLREKGMSKQKAARIANSPTKKTARKGGRHKKYELWTKDELYRKAQAVGIEGRSKMSKSELIRALRRGA